MEKAQLLKEIDRSHRELMGAYTGLSEQTLETEPVAGTWSIRDILIHISFWQDRTLGFVDRFMKEGQVVYIDVGDFNALNNEAVARRQENTNMVQLVDELTTQYRRARLAVMAATQEQLDQPWPIPGSGKTRSMSRAILIEVEHDDEHAAQIRQWRVEKGL